MNRRCIYFGIKKKKLFDSLVYIYNNNSFMYIYPFMNMLKYFYDVDLSCW